MSVRDLENMESGPPAKRPRTLPKCHLQQLPQNALIRIVSHMYPPNFTAGADRPLSISSLKYVLELRLVCKSLRNAVDAHIVSLSLREIPPSKMKAFLKGPLRTFSPRELHLSANNLRKEIQSIWKEYLAFHGRQLRSLWYFPPYPENYINYNNAEESAELHNNSINDTSQIFAEALPESLRKLVTWSPRLLYELGRLNKTVHKLHVHLLNFHVDQLRIADQINKLQPRFLELRVSDAEVGLLRKLKAFRIAIHLYQPRQAVSVDLPKVIGLYEVSLVDVESWIIAEQFVTGLEGCNQIVAISFEDCVITSAHIERIARRFEGLQRLRILKCSHVTDDALCVVAKHCCNVEIELLFVRDQFSPETLAKFGNRISWGSCT